MISSKKWNDEVGFECEFLAYKSQTFKIRKRFASLYGNCFKIKEDSSVFSEMAKESTTDYNILGYELVINHFPLKKAKTLFIDAMNILQDYETNYTCGLHVNISCKNIRHLNPIILYKKYDFDSSAKKYRRYTNYFCTSYKKYFNRISNKINCLYDNNLDLLKISKKKLNENAFDLFMKNAIYNDKNYKKSIIYNAILQKEIDKFEFNGYKYHNINLRNIKNRGYLEVRFFGNKKYQFKTLQILKDIDDIILAIHGSIKLP